MSQKRAATSELNHDNWNEEEPLEESGTFRPASKDELQRRQFRTARRRKQAGDDSQVKSSIFSGFSGFANKPAPSSFDFLSNLTNGAGETSNGSPTQTLTPSQLGRFGSPPTASSTTIIPNTPKSDGTNPGLFGIITSSSDSKAEFGKSLITPPVSFSFGTQSPKANESKPDTVFGVSSSSTATTSKHMFGIPSSSPTTVSSGSKPTDMFSAASKMSPVSSSTPTSGLMVSVAPKISAVSGDSKAATAFGMASMNTEKKSDSVFGISNSSTSMPALKLHTGSTCVNSMVNSESKTARDSGATRDKIMTDGHEEMRSSTDSKTQYYSKLKVLNESVSEWIKKHVNENSLCLLTPIFRDYERYLKELEDELKASETTSSVFTKNVTESKAIVTPPASISSLFSSIAKAATTVCPTTPAQSAGLSLTSVASTSTPFSFGTVTSSASLGTGKPLAPFSFGIGSEFTFKATSAQKATENSEGKNDEEDEDAPPKVEFTPIVEENSVFDKRCKIFFKKDGNFVDKGVCTLYIKTVESSSKHQLIVRANTILGTVLLNCILSESIPVQRVGKNNVMVVCVPTPVATPDAKPVPILIRVKTAEEADDLLETLNRYKK